MAIIHPKKTRKFISPKYMTGMNSRQIRRIKTSKRESKKKKEAKTYKFKYIYDKTIVIIAILLLIYALISSPILGKLIAGYTFYLLWPTISKGLKRK